MEEYGHLIFVVLLAVIWEDPDFFSSLGLLYVWFLDV